MSAKEKHRVIKGNIIYIILLIAGGAIMMSVGAITANQGIPLKTDDEFQAEFTLQDGKKGDLDIRFHAPNGLMPYRGITPTMTVSFHENKNNTSTVEMEFLNGRVLNPNDDPYIPKEGKLALFNYTGNDSKVSTYSAKPDLVYYNAGQFNTRLIIKNDDTTNLDKVFGTVIEIASWDSYLSQQRDNESRGLTEMVIGIGLITTAPTFTKLLDLFYKSRQLKKKAFYE